MLAEGVVSHLQHLQVWESKVIQVSYSFNIVIDLIASKWEYIKFHQTFEAADLSNVIAKKWEISQFAQLIESFNLLNKVEGEIEPLQVYQVIKTLNPTNDIIVKLQLSEAVECLEVIYLYNVSVGEGEMSQLP